MKVMMELQMTLDFTCWSCQQPVTVTVQCTGKGLVKPAPPAVAAVNVPCPTCNQVNQLCFEPGGTVREVRPFVSRSWMPEPSVN
jgi:hypothetical protein